MHEAAVGAGRCDEARDGRLVTKCRHVVDDARAGLQRRLGYGRLAGVDRDRARSGQTFDHGHNTLELLGLGHGRGAGPCRLAADVEDGGALARELLTVLDGGVGAEVQPAVGERVRRDVDDAHDDGPAGRQIDHGTERTLALDCAL